MGAIDFTNLCVLVHVNVHLYLYITAADTGPAIAEIARSFVESFSLWFLFQEMSVVIYHSMIGSPFHFGSQSGRVSGRMGRISFLKSPGNGLLLLLLLLLQWRANAHLARVHTRSHPQSILRELLDVLSTQSTNAHATRLEVIIIYLIFVEVAIELVWNVVIKDLLHLF